MTILAVSKGLSGETIIFVAVTQLTFDRFVLNFGEALFTKNRKSLKFAKMCSR